MSYTTIVLVVQSEDAERTRRTATATGATLFSANLPGVTTDALTAGAEPDAWNDETRG